MSKKETRLIINPAGFLGDKDCLIFEQGMWSCGGIHNGMGVQVGLNSGGGVISTDDLKKLRNAINRHLYAVKKEQN